MPAIDLVRVVSGVDILLALVEEIVIVEEVDLANALAALAHGLRGRFETICNWIRWLQAKETIDASLRSLEQKVGDKIEVSGLILHQLRLLYLVEQDVEDH